MLPNPPRASQNRQVPKLMPDDSASFETGTFVSSTANDFGVGKLLSLDGAEAIIEYFDGPSDAAIHEARVPAETVSQEALERQSRVYIRDPEGSGWSVGTLLWHRPPEARVTYPDGDEENVSDSQLYIRWNCPVQDPTIFLANQIIESTTYAQARRRFLLLMSQQRSETGGLPCLLSSAVDLEHHQVEVVRRVLQDPVQRYLLGDEVGLGKTIEAGLLIRQHVCDHPSQHQVLVVVPKTLNQQWRHELATRFGLQAELDSSICVTEVGKLPSLEAALHPTLVVIDEAHQIASLHGGAPAQQICFDVVRRLATISPRLLLLTATPLLHNERDYLTMLHLLDPQIYSIEDIEGFRTRVAQRQGIAEACFVLKPDTPNGFLLDAVQRIQEHLPLDPLVKQLARKLQERLDIEADESDPQRNQFIEDLRIHLSEVYKLHRRLLRNRRVGELRDLTPGRKGATLVPYLDKNLSNLFESLERWRACGLAASKHAGSATAPEFFVTEFTKLLGSCLELGHGIQEILAQRPEAARLTQSQLSDSFVYPELFEGEAQLLQEMVTHAAATAGSQLRIQALGDCITEDLESAKRWVVFCSATTIADKVYASLRKTLPACSVLRHTAENSEWRSFYSDQAPTVLVCDRSAEEGLNLQGRESVLVHFDLPFSPGRIEQRMGRLDRFGRGNPVRSLVLCAEGTAWEESWFAFMNEGLDVFRDSIASLQYSTADWLSRGTARSFLIGCDAWSDLAAQLAGEKGEVAREKRRIAEQDAMDIMDLSVDAEQTFVDRLRALETDDFIRHFSEALHTWSKKALRVKFAQEGSGRLGIFRLVLLEELTRIPHRLFKKFFTSGLDPTCHHVSLGNLSGAASRRMSFRRTTAQEGHALVARYGEAFLDALYEYTRRDDRGTCSALWRARKKIPQAYEGSYVRLDFVVEAEDSSALALCNGSSDPRAIRRAADAILPPIHLGLWLNSDHEKVTDEKLLAWLRLPPVPPQGPGQEGDWDLDQSHWKMVAHLDAFKDWHPRLKRSLEVALDIISNSGKFKEHLLQAKQSARSQLRKFESQMASRLTILPKSEREAEAWQIAAYIEWRNALINSLDAPRILFDSAGVMVLDRRGFTF